MSWFVPRKTEIDAKSAYEALKTGHSESEIAAAIEDRVPCTSPAHEWAKRMREAYHVYAHYLDPNARNLERSRRLQLLDPSPYRGTAGF